MWDVGAVKVCLEASSRLRVCARVRRVLQFLGHHRVAPPWPANSLLFSLPQRQLQVWPYRVLFTINFKCVR